MNLYRGCSHGCIYCDSRSLCYGMSHQFEDIEVKENAIDLLWHALMHKRSKAMIGMGSMTDPYIPLEGKLQHTRKALELCLKYGFGITLITKSTLVLRDLDLLEKINERTKAVVQMTLTTFDESLCRKIEPHVSTTRERFEALCTLQKAGIPTVVWLCPILPYVNDTEQNIRGILDYCIQAKVRGVLCFGMGLTLRDGNREYCYEQFDKLFLGLKEVYMREFGNAYEIPSPNSDHLMKIFHSTLEKAGIMHSNAQIFDYLVKYEAREEPSLFCM